MGPVGGLVADHRRERRPRRAVRQPAAGGTGAPAAGAGATSTSEGPSPATSRRRCRPDGGVAAAQRGSHLCEVEGQTKVGAASGQPGEVGLQPLDAAVDRQHGLQRPQRRCLPGTAPSPATPPPPPPGRSRRRSRCRYRRPATARRGSTVRIGTLKVAVPPGRITPNAPQYQPRGPSSSSAITDIAASFGAPVTEPHGNSAANASASPTPGRGRPVTVEVSCHTVGSRCSSNSRSTVTVPGFADPAEVVAEQVDDHQVLCPVLRAGQQRLRRMLDAEGALHRLGHQQPVAAMEEQLRRDARHPGAGTVDGIPAGLGCGERSEVGERVEADRPHRPPTAGEVHLVAVAGGDVLAYRPDRRLRRRARRQGPGRRASPAPAAGEPPRPASPPPSRTPRNGQRGSRSRRAGPRPRLRPPSSSAHRPPSCRPAQPALLPRRRQEPRGGEQRRVPGAAGSVNRPRRRCSRPGGSAGRSKAAKTLNVPCRRSGPSTG